MQVRRKEAEDHVGLLELVLGRILAPPAVVHFIEHTLQDDLVLGLERGRDHQEIGEFV